MISYIFGLVSWFFFEWYSIESNAQCEKFNQYKMCKQSIGLILIVCLSELIILRYRNFSSFYHEKFLILFPHLSFHTTFLFFFSLSLSLALSFFYISLYCEMIWHQFSTCCQFRKSAHGLKTLFKHFVWSATTNNQPTKESVPNRAIKTKPTNQVKYYNVNKWDQRFNIKISSRWSLIFITCRTTFFSITTSKYTNNKFAPLVAFDSLHFPSTESFLFASFSILTRSISFSSDVKQFVTLFFFIWKNITFWPFFHCKSTTLDVVCRTFQYYRIDVYFILNQLMRNFPRIF